MLEDQNVYPRYYDSCMLIYEKVISLACVDYFLRLSKYSKDIDEVIKSLQKGVSQYNWEMTQSKAETVEEFLGI